MNAPGTTWRRTGRTASCGASVAAWRCTASAPHEVDLLFKERLIGVTAFFRDPQVWQEPKDEVLPARRAGPAGDAKPRRAGVVGGSTGEEACTLAMLFTEAVEAAPAHRGRQPQVFATDPRADAIAAARAGDYPASIAGDPTPARPARFFREQAGGDRIDERIRTRVPFARHDPILDPPFTRRDILSCRNPTISFGAALQRRLMPLCHYRLRPGGVLLLGASGTVGRSQARFRPVRPESRLHRRNDHGAAIGSLDFPTPRRPASWPPRGSTRSCTPRSRDAAHAGLQPEGDPRQRRAPVLGAHHAVPDARQRDPGVVITFVDSTVARQLESRLRKA